MNVKEFMRQLAKQGATFKDAGGNHQKVYLNGKQTVLSRHLSQELKKGTIEGIKKQLGLK
jgi:mRNA interferase HicA